MPTGPFRYRGIASSFDRVSCAIRCVRVGPFFV